MKISHYQFSTVDLVFYYLECKNSFLSDEKSDCCFKVEIGTRCKINLCETLYVITDIREKNITIRLDENTTRQIIDFFVDLKEVENPEITVNNLSVTNIYEV